MKHYVFICLTLFVSISFSGCLKKGEDDPAISLRSRKGRVDGEWRVVSIKYISAFTSYNASISNNSIVFTSNGSTYTLVSVSNNVSTSESGTHFEEWEFDKDGTYKLSYVLDGEHTTSAGKWNFTSGIGDTKNKSQITLFQETEINSSGQSTYSGTDIDNVFEIKELRHKKMVWYYHRTEKTTDGLTDIEYEIEFEAN